MEFEQETLYCEESQGHLEKSSGAVKSTGFGVSETWVLISMLQF